MFLRVCLLALLVCPLRCSLLGPPPPALREYRLGSWSAALPQLCREPRQHLRLGSQLGARGAALGGRAAGGVPGALAPARRRVEGQRAAGAGGGRGHPRAGVRRSARTSPAPAAAPSAGPSTSPRSWTGARPGRRRRRRSWPSCPGWSPSPATGCSTSAGTGSARGRSRRRGASAAPTSRRGRLLRVPGQSGRGALALLRRDDRGLVNGGAVPAGGGRQRQGEGGGVLPGRADVRHG